MAPLDRNARQKGRKAMEKSLTAAARVRRKMKVGRPITNNESLTTLQALYRLTQEADKARALMEEEHLKPDDILCGLVYALITKPIRLGVKVLPPPNRTAKFFEYFEQLGTEVLFLGIMWQQKDYESKGEEPFNVWFSPLTTKPRDHVLLAMAGEWVLEHGQVEMTPER
jgi:hypothetical protein